MPEKAVAVSGAVWSIRFSIDLLRRFSSILEYNIYSANQVITSGS
jgi:hypothetical protein